MGNTAFLAIALTLVAIHLGGEPLSGASVNPARTLGSAIMGANYDAIWVYLTAPFVGAGVGWVFFAAVTGRNPADITRS